MENFGQIGQISRNKICAENHGENHGGLLSCFWVYAHGNLRRILGREMAALSAIKAHLKNHPWRLAEQSAEAEFFI